MPVGWVRGPHISHFMRHFKGKESRKKTITLGMGSRRVNSLDLGAERIIGESL